MSRSRVFTAIASIVIVAAVFQGADPAFALNPGDTVTFQITADSNQPEPPSGPHDKLIYTGGQVTSIDTTSCGPIGEKPVQNAVLVDPAGGRSGRIIGIITLSHTDPIPPGTKLTTLIPLSTCMIGTTAYTRYQGTVE